jgi:hypothetical protein
MASAHFSLSCNQEKVIASMIWAPQGHNLGTGRNPGTFADFG